MGKVAPPFGENVVNGSRHAYVFDDDPDILRSVFEKKACFKSLLPEAF